MIRKLRLPFAVLALALSAFTSAAHAQFSFYGLFTADRLSGISSSPVLQTLAPLPCTNPGVSPTNCTQYNNYVNPLGFTGGAAYDFKTFGPVTLGVDARGGVQSSKHGAQTFSNGSGAHIYDALGGIRASFKTPLKMFRPYVQGSVGFARSNYGLLTNAGVMQNGSPIFPGIPSQNNLEYHVFGGFDVRILPWADWRVAELGYGGIRASGTDSHSYPLYSVSTGVVFHIPPRQ